MAQLRRAAYGGKKGKKEPDAAAGRRVRLFLSLLKTAGALYYDATYAVIDQV